MKTSGFAAAQVSLGTLARGGLLAGVARLAYADGISGLHRAVTLNGPSGLPELVDVQARELVMHDGIATLALRWQAWDPTAGLFPALDANLTLVPGHPAALLTLAGAYRPPPRVRRNRAGPGHRASSRLSHDREFPQPRRRHPLRS